MKNRILLLVMGSLLVFFTADPVLAQDSALGQLERMAGRTAGSVPVPPVPSPTCAYCGGKGGHHYPGCPYFGRSGARARRRAVPWGTARAGGLSSSEQFAAQAFSSLLGSLMQDLMAPPPQPDTSYQQQLRKQQQEAEAARIKQKELERQEALRQWQEFQDKETSERAMERAEKEKQNRELLAKMQTLGSDEPLRMESMSGGKLEPFMWEKREEELELQVLWSNPNVVDLSDKKVDTPMLLRPASEEGTGPAPDVGFGNWYRGREPKVDGELGVVGRKLAGWYGDEWKSKSVDWLSAATGLPVNKIMKIKGMVSFHEETYIKPIMEYVKGGTAAAVSGNDARIAEFVKDDSMKVDEETRKKAQDELRGAYLGAGGSAGEVANDLISAGEEAGGMYDD